MPNSHDWKVSCDPSDFPRLVADIRIIEAACGTGLKTIGAEEQKSIAWARKSITACVSIAEGTVLKLEHIFDQRPGTGIPLSELETMLGRTVKLDIAAGTLLKQEMLERDAR